MQKFKMPLFDIESTKDFIFVGGGDGINNGVSAIYKGDLSGKSEVTFATVDRIHSIEVYDKYDNTVDMLDYDEDELRTNDERPPKNESVKTGDGLAKNLEVDIQTDSNWILIAAIGDENFYLLRWNEEFQLLSQINRKFTRAILAKHLILLDGYDIYGFYDVESTSPIQMPQQQNDKPMHVNKLKKVGNNLICVNENPDDSLGAWNDAFVKDGKLHKVSFLKELSVFEFDGVDAEVDGNIEEITCRNGNLAFYTAFSSGSLLDINGKDFRLPLISAIANDGKHVIAASKEGNIYVYGNGELLNRLDGLPKNITDLSIYGTQLNYTCDEGFGKCEMLDRKLDIGKILAAMGALVILSTLISLIFNYGSSTSYINKLD